MKKALTENLLLILLPLLGSAFVFSSSLIDGALISRILFCSIYLLIVSIYLFIQNGKSGEWKIALKNPVTGLFSLWLLATLISGINAINFAEYVAESQKVFLYFSLYLVFGIVLRKDDLFRADYFFKAIVISTAALLGIGVYQFFNYDCSLTSEGMSKVTGMMNNRNLFSEYLTLCFPLLLAAVFSLKSVWRIVAIVVSFASILAIAILFTRSAYVALAISSLFTVVVFFVKSKSIKSDSEWGFKQVGIIAGIVIAFAAGFFVLNSASNNSLLHRAKSIVAYDKGSAGGRIKIWKVSQEMIHQSSMLGVGAGNWKINYESFNLNQDGNTFTTEPLNDYIGIYCESGILGLIGYAGVLLCGIILLMRRKLSAFQLAALASLIIFDVISFFNFPKDRIEPSVMMCFLLAFASTEYRNSAGTTISRSARYIVAIYSILLLFVIVVSVKRYNAEAHTLIALQARDHDDWGKVIREIEKAETEFYTLDPTTTPLKWYSGIAHYSLGDQTTALRNFQIAYEQNPYHLHVINNLATATAVTGDPERALPLFDKALKINPLFYDAIYNKTIVLYNLHRYDEALKFIDNWELRRDPKIREYIELLKDAKGKK